METLGHETAAMFLRWLHLLGGIFWFGLAFFMNFVHSAYMPALDPESRRRIILGLVPRVMVFMFGGAVVSIASGLVLGAVAPRHPSADSDWLNIGILLGFTIFGVGLLVVLPMTLKIMRLARANKPPASSFMKTLLLFSKLNVYLAIPLIFCMLAGAGHFLHPIWPAVVGFCLLGWLCVWLLFQRSTRVFIGV